MGWWAVMGEGAALDRQGQRLIGRGGDGVRGWRSNLVGLILTGDAFHAWTTKESSFVSTLQRNPIEDVVLPC